MAKARHVSGEYTPWNFGAAGSALEAGDVVVKGNRPCIALRDIAQGEDEVLAIHGGVWELEKDGSAGPVVAVGEEVAWDTGNEQATDTITGNVHFGWCVEAAATNDATVKAFLDPHGADTNDDS